MATERMAERILRFIGKTDYRPQRVQALARSLGIAEREYGAFSDTVKALMKTGRLVLGSSKVLTLPEPAGRIVGTFRLNPRGFGFVIPEAPDAHGDLYVPRGQGLDAVTGDTVVARVLKRGKRDGKMSFEGRIVEVLKRGRNQFVGELCTEFGRWFVHPDGNTIHAPIFVDDPGAKSARAGDQVVVEILRYPLREREARGVIVRVLGERGLPEVDTLSIIVQHQLPEAFEDEVLAAATESVRAYDPDQCLDGREDLRKLTIITIDPVDARDFDDAISLTENDDGTCELGVHIADVSHFVPLDGTIDIEARERSTSVYFPKHVIPMLPEVLSNGVCSLQEREPRLVKSAFITYDRKGKVLRQRFANSVIRSAKRLTYEQASAVLDGKPGRISKKVVALIERMATLARAIRKRRIKEGMLVLDLPEVELIYDKSNKVVGVEPADTSFSHTIIEMFMIEANESVARLFASIGVPCLRRVHPEPNEAASESLAKFLAAVGVKVPKNIDRFAMQSMLQQVAGKPVAYAVNLALLKSMQSAVYSPEMLGHFALASEHYLHFTSPIRRYPDLTAHRLLDAYVKGGLKTKAQRANHPEFKELVRMGERCSQCERRAEDAERELRMVKILRLLADRVGDALDGVVTGVTNFGLYVQLSEYLVDGLLRFEELSDDWWEVDPDRGCVIAERSGERITLGQQIEVVIVKIDVAARQMDLAPAGAVKSPRKRGAKAKTRMRKHTPRGKKPGSKNPRGKKGAGGKGGRKKQSRRRH